MEVENKNQPLHLTPIDRTTRRLGRLIQKRGHPLQKPWTGIHAEHPISTVSFARGKHLSQQSSTFACARDQPRAQRFQGIGPTSQAALDLRAGRHECPADGATKESCQHGPIGWHVRVTPTELLQKPRAHRRGHVLVVAETDRRVKHQQLALVERLPLDGGRIEPSAAGHDLGYGGLQVQVLQQTWQTTENGQDPMLPPVTIGRKTVSILNSDVLRV